MIIECQECHARFRLDETRIKGKGARVRCRRCGESILVMKEEGGGPFEASEAPPAPAPGQFDINLAVEGALGSGSEGIATRPPEAFDMPAPGLFDINRAVGESLEPTLEPEPAPTPAPEESAATAFEPFPEIAIQPLEEPAPAPPSTWQAVVEPAPEGAPPVYETGFDPFAAAEAEGPLSPEQVAQPILLTEAPVELAPAETAPPAPTPALDDVDLAFEQFLSGSDAEFTAAAPPPEEAAPDVPLPTPDDGLFDLTAIESAALEPGSAPEVPEPSPFLLNDADTLELLGNRYKTDEGERPPTATAPKEDVFAFQLDEESMAVPDRVDPSPFMHNAAEAAMAVETPPPPADQVPESLPPRQPPLPQEIPVPKSALRGDRPGAGGAPSARPTAAIVFGALFIVLAGAVGYLGFSGAGRGFLRSAIPSLGPLLGGEPSPKKGGAQFDIRNLIGYYDNTSVAGRMFVIKGQVANIGQATRGSIRVHAALLDNTNKMLAEKTVYAGNVLGGEALRIADKATIEKTLSSPFGEGLTNMDVAPGKSVPFMVVFLDIPEGIDAYRLEAKEGE